ncbi:hypothetical protein Tco_1069436 [Tanacetum coccineum]|uniref:Uncharacterized protein n=1 Tax=Tanacetum coccineum TaxID=301880 RepID=A0ABQ5HJY2_9ASTR
MADLTFADSHNIVAYLEKSEDNADFAEIVNFLDASPIRKTKRKATKISQSSRPTTLVADETVHKERGDSVERVATTATSLDAEQGSGGSPRRQDTIGDRPAQTRFERLSKQSNEPPLSRLNTLGSGEDSMKLQELMDLYTKLSDRVLDLENVKNAQALEIKKLKKRVKKLESKKKSRTLQLKRRLFKVRIKSFVEKSLEDSETRGRYGYDIGVNIASTLITTVNINITTAEPVTTASAPVTTAGVSVSTAEPSTPPTTTTKDINREDLETLWKLVKANQGNTRPEETYERVLWGDLKVMSEPNVESEIWRNLQGYKVTVWKLFSLCGVNFVRFQNMHIFMLVEKKYPLTPATITEMLNKKLQIYYLNEMCYQLLKLMTKQNGTTANDGIQVSDVGLTYYLFLQLFLNNQIENLEAVFNDKYDTPSHTKKVFANMRRQGKDFLRTVTPLFPSMLASQAVDSGPTTLVADETVHEERGDSVERAATTAASLDAEQDSGNIIRTQSMATLNEPIPQGTSSGSGPKRQDTILGDMSAQTRLSERVLALENIKTAQNLEIINLKKRVKKLEKKKKARTPQLKRRLFKVRIESSAEKSLETQGSAPVTPNGVSVSTAKPSTPLTTTILIEDEDLTIAQTLMKMRSVKSKEKGVSSETTIRPTRGVIMKEASETITRPIVPPQQQLDTKDKGKGIMQEPEKPVKMKSKDQITFDEEVAQRLEAQMQAEYEEEERVARQREEEDNLISWDNTQAMIEADYD